MLPRSFVQRQTRISLATLTHSTSSSLLFLPFSLSLSFFLFFFLSPDNAGAPASQGGRSRVRQGRLREAERCPLPVHEGVVVLERIHGHAQLGRKRCITDCSDNDYDYAAVT